jgi:hypothetical protein
MRFAFSGSQRCEASPEGKGRCPVCRGDVLAKCGTERVWHWAHRVKTKCDHWWESETAWHRNWKTVFPADWQEVIVKGENGELHIADVRTPLGLSVEFQHSPIPEDEREVREEFYGDMIWVLDGTLGNQGYGNFMENIRFWQQREPSAGQIGARFNPMLAKITKRWITARRPVLIDFGGNTLWSISVKRDGWAKYALEVKKDFFVSSVIQNGDPAALLSPWQPG